MELPFLRWNCRSPASPSIYSPLVLIFSPFFIPYRRPGLNMARQVFGVPSLIFRLYFAGFFRGKARSRSVALAALGRLDCRPSPLFPSALEWLLTGPTAYQPPLHARPSAVNVSSIVRSVLVWFSLLFSTFSRLSFYYQWPSPSRYSNSQSSVSFLRYQLEHSIFNGLPKDIFCEY